MDESTTRNPEPYAGRPSETAVPVDVRLTGRVTRRPLTGSHHATPVEAPEKLAVVILRRFDVFATK
jgi:hypothetical protein